MKFREKNLQDLLADRERIQDQAETVVLVTNIFISQESNGIPFECFYFETA